MTDPAPARVPFLDLAAHHAPIRAELDAAWARVVGQSAFILGEEVARFEANFAAFLGVPHAVGVASGLDALTLTLRALHVGPGDEVILPANTFIATALAVSANGARPILVDCDPATALMDLSAATAAVTSRTRALLPVHLYGRPCDAMALGTLARRHGLAVVEDACQAHGAALGDRRCGTFGEAAAFSFYPGKNLGAFGDSGLVATADESLATSLRRLRCNGEAAKYDHVVQGANSRLDALQAAVLGVKLRRLTEANAARAAAAARYDRDLGDAPGIVPLPPPAPDTTHVYHLYVVRVLDGARDTLREHLAAAGIDTGIHYPVPIHLQPAYAELGYRRGDFPVAERLADDILSLPMYPELTPEQIERVVEAIVAFSRARARGVRFAGPGAEHSCERGLVTAG